MIVGIPGSGVGGVFYLLSALWMPISETVMTMRGRSNARRWLTVGMQTGLACGISFGMWSTGWLLGFVLTDVFDIVQIEAGQSANIFSVAPIVIASITLGSVLLVVQVLRAVVRREAILEEPGRRVEATSGKPQRSIKNDPPTQPLRRCGRR